MSPTLLTNRQEISLISSQPTKPHPYPYLHSTSFSSNHQPLHSSLDHNNNFYLIFSATCTRPSLSSSSLIDHHSSSPKTRFIITFSSVQASPLDRLISQVHRHSTLPNHTNSPSLYHSIQQTYSTASHHHLSIVSISLGHSSLRLSIITACSLSPRKLLDLAISFTRPLSPSRLHHF